MREIKFRGLAKHGWEYGLPFYSHGLGSWSITRSNGWRPSYSNPDEGESTEYIEVDPKTITQFTGLTDKNGTDIYEGDILDYPWEICKVVFDDGHFETFSNTGSDSIRGCDECEVIGNIYENPELIGGEV